MASVSTLSFLKSRLYAKSRLFKVKFQFGHKISFLKLRLYVKSRFVKSRLYCIYAYSTSALENIHLLYGIELKKSITNSGFFCTSNFCPIFWSISGIAENMFPSVTVLWTINLNFTREQNMMMMQREPFRVLPSSISSSSIHVCMCMCVCAQSMSLSVSRRFQRTLSFSYQPK